MVIEKTGNKKEIAELLSQLDHMVFVAVCPSQAA